MNDYAEAFKNRFSGFAISNEEIAVFSTLHSGRQKQLKIYVAERFKALASLCRFIDDTFKAIQDTAESLAAIFEQVDALTLPPPLSRLQRHCGGRSGGGRAGGNAGTAEITLLFSTP